MQGLRKLREDKGLKQCDVARESRISGTHLSNVERGKRNPSMAALERILEALGATLTADAIVAEVSDGKTTSVKRYTLK